MDLLEESSFTELEALLESEKPNVKLLVNAAGFGKFGAYQKVPVEDDCRMIDLNCKALLLMTRPVSYTHLDVYKRQLERRTVEVSTRVTDSRFSTIRTSHWASAQTSDNSLI